MTHLCSDRVTHKKLRAFICKTQVLKALSSAPKAGRRVSFHEQTRVISRECRRGIQTDEALLAAGVYEPFAPNYVIRVAGLRLPMMTMSYVGTVKSWLYRPILAFRGPSPATLRVPAVIIGAITVWLFAC